jgi:hypothetical protein
MQPHRLVHSLPTLFAAPDRSLPPRTFAENDHRRPSCDQRLRQGRSAGGQRMRLVNGGEGGKGQLKGREVLVNLPGLIWILKG